MTTENFTTTIIRAADGMKLTQAADVEITKRLVASSVALGRNDSPANWREITDEEAAAIRAEIEAENQKQIDADGQDPESAVTTQTDSL